MSELESREGVYSLEYRKGSDLGGDAEEDRRNRAIPHTDGCFQDRAGLTWAADVSLSRKPLDVGEMTLAWVESTEDPLFRDLEKDDRLLLYLTFARLQGSSTGREVEGEIAAARGAPFVFMTFRNLLQRPSVR